MTPQATEGREVPTKRYTCTNHCATCGSHFSSLAAFDAHRSGPYSGKRECWGNPDVGAIYPATEDGTCRLTAETHVDITIWEHENASLVRAHFSRERPSAATNKRQRGLLVAGREAA
jgi:hypothetical protein